MSLTATDSKTSKILKHNGSQILTPSEDRSQIGISFLNVKSDIKDACLKCAIENLDLLIKEELKYPQEVAEQIKKFMDSEFGINWHVIVGASFSSWISYEKDGCLMFNYNEYSVLAWKHA